MIFSRGHATLHLAVSVGPSVRRSVRYIFEFRAVFTSLLLPNRPRLDFRVSGLVYAGNSYKELLILFTLLLKRSKQKHRFIVDTHIFFFNYDKAKNYARFC